MGEVILSAKAQKTREHLLETSLEMMKKVGYQNVTVRDICAQADVSVGTFYSYYPSKTDIFLDIYKRADDYFAETVAVKIEGDNAKDRIVDFFGYYAQLNVDTGVDLLKILFNPENSWFIKKRPMQRVLAEIVSAGYARKELSDKVKEADVVDYLFTIARGCCYNWCILEGKTDLVAQTKHYIRLAVSAF